MTNRNRSGSHLFSWQLRSFRIHPALPPALLPRHLMGAAFLSTPTIHFP